MTPTRRLLALPAVRRLAALCALLAVGSWACLLVQWALVARVVVTVASGRTAPEELTGTLAGALGAWALRAALTAARTGVAAHTSTRVRSDARAALARTFLRLGPEVASGERAGELVTTATTGVTALDGVVARLVPGVAHAAVLPALVAVTVLVLDPWSGLVLALTGPLLLVFLWLVGTRAARSSREQWERLGQLGGLLVDTLRVLPTLVAYGRASSSVGWLAGVSEGYRAATMRVLRTAFLSGFVLEFGATLCTALVAVTVGVRVFEGHLGFDRALLVLLLTPEFFAPLRALGGDHHAALEGRPAAARLFALLDRAEPEPEPEPERRPGTAAALVRVPVVEVQGVTVRLQGRAVLSEVDLVLPACSRTALVGPSGAGKSSLVRLLLGLHEPDEGRVLVDGTPLADLDGEGWRAVVGYVPERPWLLAGTVAENVRAGRADATDDEVEQALAAAHAVDFVRRLPDGAATRLGEDGARLSGGERLRLALARALVKDPAVLLLDEPTSQLDPVAEAAVVAALHEAAAGRTLVTVTHRSAPLGLHDRVVEVAGGRVREPEVLR